MLGLRCSLLFLSTICALCAERGTDVSLFMREAPEQALTECFSESGDLYLELGHHGPAIENPYYALRLYFDRKGGIDIYSKKYPGLELGATRWYPSAEQRAAGFGGDFYHVGDTVGLGGVRLWDGEQVLRLDPVAARRGRVVREDTVSIMEIRSEEVPYRGGLVDVLVRITVFSDRRVAKVEVFSLSDEPVQFVTGLNHRKGEQFTTGDEYLLSWAAASGGVADGPVEVGAALMFDADDLVQSIEEPSQALLVSKPCKQLEYWICSANSMESELNTMAAFERFVHRFIFCCSHSSDPPERIGLGLRSEFVPNRRNLYIGSRKNKNNFVGDMDEVKLSSAD